MDFYSNDDILKKIYSNIPIQEFKGSVMYVGMGSAWVPRQQPSNVYRTLIIEKDKEIIDKYSHLLKPDWEVVNEDAWMFYTEEKFDFIFIDIWNNLVLDKYMVIIESLYSKYLRPGGKILFLEQLRAY
jgi:predicted O-methyltransferase YrrM